MDIIKTCYEAIRVLDISDQEKETLLGELAERGFTQNLKDQLAAYLERQLGGSPRPVEG